MNPDGTTSSKEEAQALLRRYRRKQQDTGREIARELDAVRDGGVCVEDIRAEMKERGIYPADLDARWIGGIFPGPGQEFRQVGTHREIKLPGTKHHDGGKWPYWTKK